MGRVNDLGVVVIGRNEGERLKTCISAFLNIGSLKLVYVDSGSTDGSVDYVLSQGFDIVNLDLSIPFSAARARNEGYRFLLNKYQNIEFIQFIDGDCEVYPDWLNKARSHLVDHHDIVAVCGRRRERYPEQTLYNRLCDIEWDTPIGICTATGGDFMCRASALSEVNGFNPSVIAGEEPELCFRLRHQGWKIERLDLEMTWHDANITTIKQWWKRMERSGHAYAQGAFMHGSSPEHYYIKDVLRIIIWALCIPAVSFLGLFIVGAWSIALLLLFPLKVLHIFTKARSRFAGVVALVYASSLVFGKFPQIKGVSSFLYKQLLGKNFQIIEYKN